MLQFHSLVNETNPALDGGLQQGEGEGFEAPQEDQWSGPSQEEWEQTQQALQYFAQQEQARQEQQQGGPPQLDPLDPNFQQQLEAWYEQKTAPIQQFSQQYQSQQAEEMAWDMLSAAEQAEGEFLLRETTNELPVASPHMARAIAEDLLPDMQARYGQGPKAVEAALTQAVKYVRQYEDAIGQAYEQRKQNELQTRLSAPMRPPGNGQAAQSLDSGAASEFDVVARHVGGGLPR